MAVSVARAVVVVVAVAISVVVVMGSVMVVVLADGADDGERGQKQTGEDEFC